MALDLIVGRAGFKSQRLPILSVFKVEHSDLSMWNNESVKCWNHICDEIEVVDLKIDDR